MGRLRFQIVAVLALAAAVGLSCVSPSLAARPGGGGSTAAYSIVDLPGPNHQVDGGWSQTYAEKIGDISTDGTVHIVGRFVDTSGNSLSCKWARNAAGAVTVVDLSQSFDGVRDVNSVGIVCGTDDGRPALLMPDLRVAYLSAQGTVGEARALNNPNNPSLPGVFQVVGLVATPPSPYEFVLWDVDRNGTVLATTPLVNAEQGVALNPLDINDSGDIVGFARIGGQYFPAVGAFKGGLQCAVLENPNPSEIAGFRELRLDASANVVGAGYQPTTQGEYARAVIWPIGGAAVDLGAVTRITSTKGNGIAVVKGAMQVVGRAESDGRGAFAYLYSNQKLNDLGPMSKGDDTWSFDRAEDVNGAGVICGVGVVGSRRSRQWHGFLLIPTGN